ncbi:HAMP domain-containing histidine kinase, partial [bacterium]|nr:HAMP domain-containing histidine kinase [candidate division CSSED10-310 bacterium]
SLTSMSDMLRIAIQKQLDVDVIIAGELDSPNPTLQASSIKLPIAEEMILLLARSECRYRGGILFLPVGAAPEPLRQRLLDIDRAALYVQTFAGHGANRAGFILLLGPRQTLLPKDREWLRTVALLTGVALTNLSLRTDFFGLKQDLEGRLEELEMVKLDYNTIFRNLLETRNVLKLRMEELENFVQGTWHDLRTPVISIGGLVHLIQEDFSEQLDDNLNHYLERIQVNLDIMSRLLEDFMAYVQISTVREKPVTFDSKELIDRILQELAEDITARGIQVKLVGDFPTITCERGRLYTVFQQLIGNPVRHMGEVAEPKIEIEAWEEDLMHRFEIRDNGLGIPEEFLPKVFEVFQRRKRGSNDTGTGMGLALVKKIIAFHGGEVGVRSDPRSGTAFWFTLPKVIDLSRTDRPSSHPID